MNCLYFLVENSDLSFFKNIRSGFTFFQIGRDRTWGKIVLFQIIEFLINITIDTIDNSGKIVFLPDVHLSEGK